MKQCTRRSTKERSELSLGCARAGLFRSKSRWVVGLPLAALVLFGLPMLEEVGATPSPDASSATGIIVAMGDSLTAGFGLSEKDAYPAILQEKLTQAGHPYQVINSGISGETSSGALSRVKWILRLKPDIVIVETGANDGFRGIDPSLIERNISEIVKTFKENNVVVILAGMRMGQNLGESYTTAFKNLYPKIAATQNVTLIPFFLEGVLGDPRLNLPDGIHPTREGYAIVADTVLPFVLKAIEEVKVRKNSPGEP